MSYPLPPGGLFPLTTAPTGRSAGGQYPLPAVLSDAIRSLAPTAYWKLDEASGNLADAMSGGYTATVTGSPTYGVALPSPIDRGVIWSGSGQYATTSASVPAPTSSMSALMAYRTSVADATARDMFSRGVALGNNYSWELRWYSTTAVYKPRAIVYQGTSSIHASIVANGAATNDDAWHLALMTFDGTTLWVYCSPFGSSGASTTTLSGSWSKTSTAGIRVAGMSDGFGDWLGTTAHHAYWADRVITAAEFRWLDAIMRGG